jgi:hypothetical protein
MTCKSLINLITNPNPFLVTNTRDTVKGKIYVKHYVMETYGEMEV